MSAVTQDRINEWLSDYIMLKRCEAKKIEDMHGVGWVSDVKYKTADEVEHFLKTKKSKIDEPIHSTFVACPLSNDNKGLSYTECIYEDGTVIRTIKTTIQELKEKKLFRG